MVNFDFDDDDENMNANRPKAKIKTEDDNDDYFALRNALQANIFQRRRYFPLRAQS